VPATPMPRARALEALAEVSRPPPRASPMLVTSRSAAPWGALAVCPTVSRVAPATAQPSTAARSEAEPRRPARARPAWEAACKGPRVLRRARTAARAPAAPEPQALAAEPRHCYGWWLSEWCFVVGLGPAESSRLE